MTANATTFKKGKEKGPGRPKGVKNKVTAEIKDMIRQALDEAGGVKYLVKCAKEPRTASAFLGLVGKVLPMAVANAEGEAFRTVTMIELVALEAPGKDS